MRSISCQVTDIEKPVIGQNESGDSTEFGLPNSNAIQVGIEGHHIGSLAKNIAPPAHKHFFATNVYRVFKETQLFFIGPKP